jgi:hypothetical protein
MMIMKKISTSDALNAEGRKAEMGFIIIAGVLMVRRLVEGKHPERWQGERRKCGPDQGVFFRREYASLDA